MTWLVRSLPSVSRMVNTSPTVRTRCPVGASARLSLPSHCGCIAGSAINSKILSAGAAIARLAVTTVEVTIRFNNILTVASSARIVEPGNLSLPRSEAPMTAPAVTSVRAGDRDRERTAKQLGLALSQGYLALDEYEHRMQAAFAAHSAAELRQLLADLPLGQLRR